MKKKDREKIYKPWENPIELTDEEIEFNKKKFQLLDYYGIPYGVIDDSKTEETTKDLDYLKASVLISQGIDLPEDLEKRLIQYKKEK